MNNEKNCRFTYRKIGSVLLDNFVKHKSLDTHLSTYESHPRGNFEKEKSFNLDEETQIDNQDNVNANFFSQGQQIQFDGSSGNQGIEGTFSKESTKIRFQHPDGELVSKRKVVCGKRESKEVRETRIDILEQKFRNEQFKRRLIQSKLVEVEVQSREIINTVENKNLELQRKLEILSNENTRLKLDHDSSIGLE